MSSRTYEIHADGTVTMRSHGLEYSMRPIKVRAYASCGPCRRFIDPGETAYRETSQTKDCYWLSGVKVCERCVRGGAQ